MSALGDRLSKGLEEVAKVQRASSRATEALSGLHGVVALPRDFKELKEEVRKMDVETKGAQEMLQRCEKNREISINFNQFQSISINFDGFQWMCHSICLDF